MVQPCEIETGGWWFFVVNKGTKWLLNVAQDMTCREREVHQFWWLNHLKKWKKARLEGGTPQDDVISWNWRFAKNFSQQFYICTIIHMLPSMWVIASDLTWPHHFKFWGQNDCIFQFGEVSNLTNDPFLTHVFWDYSLLILFRWWGVGLPGQLGCRISSGLWWWLCGWHSTLTYQLVTLESIGYNNVTYCI